MSVCGSVELSFDVFHCFSPGFNIFKLLFTMATVDGELFVNDCRSFFDKFKDLMSVNDPLPVKVGGYSINDHEVDGEIVDWSLQYLQQRNCPTRLLPHLISEVLQNVRSLLSAATSKELIEESSDKGFPPIRLMHLVIEELNKVCLKYQDNQHFEKLSLDLGKSCRPQLNPVSVYAIKNTRRKMEDRHVVLQDMNAFCNLTDQLPRSYFAVFDGHAGTDAAFYAAAQLYQYLVKNPNFVSNTTVALKEAFMEADVAFIRKNKFENLKGGTTAVVALVSGSILSVAWLGDSQAILVKEGLVTSLVNPHKPDRADEKERIAQLGGEIVYWDGAYRVNGQLAVSRAIGDASYKPYVTAEPDVISITLDGSEDFLILACDGLWDTIGLKEAAFLVHQHLHHSPDDLVGVSTRLVQAAKQKGSSDNISVIVVFFRDPAEIAVRPLPAAPETPPESPLSSAAMEEQQQQQQRELEHLAAKWGWGQSQGAMLFGEAPWQQQEQQHDHAPSAAVEQTNGIKTSPLNPEAPEFTWNPAASIQGAGWNQFDEELSGQPSLLSWEQNEQHTVANSQPAETEQTTPEVAPQHHEETVHHVVDEVDRSQVLPSQEEPLPNRDTGVVLSSQADIKEGVPFNWNLSAPEFEFTAVPDQQAASSDLLEGPSSQPRKLSAAEVLAKSANDAELAVLLAAASDDPDEENSEAADPELLTSPKPSNAEEQTLAHQDSRGDTTFEEAADSEEDDWTYYRGDKEQEDGQKMDYVEVVDVPQSTLSPAEAHREANFVTSTPMSNIPDIRVVTDTVESPVINVSVNKDALAFEVEVISSTITIEDSSAAYVTAEERMDTAFETIELSTENSEILGATCETGQAGPSLASEDQVEEHRQQLENLTLAEPTEGAVVEVPAQTAAEGLEVATTNVEPSTTEEEMSEVSAQPPAPNAEEAGVDAEEAALAANAAPEVADGPVDAGMATSEETGIITNGDTVVLQSETVTQEEAALMTVPAAEPDCNPGPVAGAAAEPSVAAEPPAEDTDSVISDTGATIGSEKVALASTAAAALVTAVASVAAAAATRPAKSPVKKPSGAAAPLPRTTAAAKKPEIKVTKVVAKSAPKPTASVPKAAPAPKLPNAAAAAAAVRKKPVPVGRAASAAANRVAPATKPASSSAASSPTKPASPAKATTAPAVSPRRPVGAAAASSGAASKATTNATSTSGATSRAAAATSAVSSKAATAAAARPALTNGDVKKPAARPGASRPTSAAASAAAARPAAATSKPSTSTAKAAAVPSLARKAPASSASAKPAPSAAQRAPPSSAAPAKPAKPPTNPAPK